MLLRYNGKNLYSIMGIRFSNNPIEIGKEQNYRFSPGINEVTNKQFKQMQEYKQFRKRLDAGIIEVIDAGSVKNNSVEKRSVSEMVAYIGDIYDINLLKKIKAKDDRTKVQVAIDAQLEKISLTDEEKKATDEKILKKEIVN